MFAVDTNVLIYAHREEFELHSTAKRKLKEIAEADEPWILFWPCLYEFVRIVTHPRLFKPPTPVETAVGAITDLVENSSAVILGETDQHMKWFRNILKKSDCTGNHVFDAHIAALMREHGVDRILTRDRDFHRFEGVEIVIPF